MTMPTRGPRGSYAKTAERRAEILAAAVRVFADAGFHGGTLRDIAARVGISQAGLLHHFASKERLLEAVLEARDETASRRARFDEIPSGAATLDAFVDLVARNEAEPGLVALFTVLSGEATAPDHPGHEYFRARYTMLLDLLEQAVVAGQQRGELRSDVHPAVAARTITALSDGLQVQWLYEHHGFDLAHPVRAYVDSLRVVPST